MYPIQGIITKEDLFMKRFDTKKMVLLALLAGILALMAFTPLGYLKFGTLSITLNMIPVAIGAIALGPAGGAILGLVFGITSFSQCFGADAFGTLLAGYSIAGTLFVTVGMRTLAGFLTGVIYKVLAGRIKNSYSIYPIIGFSAAALNTVLFMSALMLCFGNISEIAAMRGGMNIIAFMCVFVGINAVFEMIACTAVTAAVAAALKSARLLPAVPEKQPSV